MIMNVSFHRASEMTVINLEGLPADRTPADGNTLACELP